MHLVASESSFFAIVERSVVLWDMSSKNRFINAINRYSITDALQCNNIITPNAHTIIIIIIIEAKHQGDPPPSPSLPAPPSSTSPPSPSTHNPPLGTSPPPLLANHTSPA
jgi:hypothetical protein